MVNEEILGGLKSAISRGDSLRKAMMTFYSSGYKKEEIEEAAQVFQSEQMQLQQPPKVVQTTKPNVQAPKTQPSQRIISKPVSIATQKPAPRVSAYGVQPIQPKTNTPVQQISDYNQAKKPKGKWMVFLIAFTLLIAAGALVSTIFFKEQFVELLDKLF